MKLFGITVTMLGLCKLLTKQLTKLTKMRVNLCNI